MDAILIADIEAAEQAIWRAFPKASMVSVEYSHHSYHNAPNERLWNITVGFTWRRCVYVVADTLAEALAQVLARINDPDSETPVGKIMREAVDQHRQTLQAEDINRDLQQRAKTWRK